MKKLMKTLAVVLAFVLAVEVPVSVSAAGLKRLGTLREALTQMAYVLGDSDDQGGTGDKDDQGGTGDKDDQGGTGDKDDQSGTGDKDDQGGTGDKDDKTSQDGDDQVVAVAIKGSRPLNLEKDDIVDLEVNVITNTYKDFSYTVEWKVEGDAVYIYGSEQGETCTIVAAQGGQATVTAYVENKKDGSVRSDSVVVNVKEYSDEIYFEDFNKDTDGDDIDDSYERYLKQKIDMSKLLKRDTDTANDDIFWSVDNKKLATVDKNGVVTMKKLTGQTPVTLTAISETGKVAQAKLYIEEGNPVTKIQLSEKNITLTDLGDEAAQVITATITTKNGGETTDELVWTSAKFNIVEVWDEGVQPDGTYKATVIAAGVGKSKVTVKASTGKSASATITAQAKLNNLYIEDEREGDSGETYPKKKITLNLIRDPEANKDKIKWSVDPSQKKLVSVSGKNNDTAVVTVKAKAVEMDTDVKITATSASGKTAEYILTILPSNVTGLTNIEGKGTLLVGEEADYTADAMEGNTIGDPEQITWTSSSTKVLTIDADGHATALKSGKATIKATVTLANGKTLTKSLKVTVTQPTTTLTMKKSLVTVVSGKKKTVSFTAVKAPKGAAGTIKYRIWESDVETVQASESFLPKNKVDIPANAQPGQTITVQASVDDVVTTEGKVLVVTSAPKILFGSESGVVSNKKLTLTQGDDCKLDPSVAPLIPEFEEVFTYTVNKKGIVSVDKEGKVTALLPGTAKITITSASGAKATVTVKVNAGQINGDDTSSHGGNDKK